MFIKRLSPGVYTYHYMMIDIVAKEKKKTVTMMSVKRLEKRNRKIKETEVDKNQTRSPQRNKQNKRHWCTDNQAPLFLYLMVLEVSRSQPNTCRLWRHPPITRTSSTTEWRGRSGCFNTTLHFFFNTHSTTSSERTTWQPAWAKRLSLGLLAWVFPHICEC